MRASSEARLMPSIERGKHSRQGHRSTLGEIHAFPAFNHIYRHKRERRHYVGAKMVRKIV